MQDEVTNFRPRGSDLDYPGKLQQQQEQQQQPSSEQTPLTHQNGNTPAASVPQQNTDSQVGGYLALVFRCLQRADSQMGVYVSLPSLCL